MPVNARGNRPMNLDIEKDRRLRETGTALKEFPGGGDDS
jgi:hypothetical protein